MRKQHIHHLGLAILLGTCAGLFAASSLSAQTPFRRRLALEVGTGVPPLHMWGNLPEEERYTLAMEGKEVDMDGAAKPLVTFSIAYPINQRVELALTGSVCWVYHKIIQYPIFGTTPEGNSRMFLDQGEKGKWRTSSVTPSAALMCRVFWTPERPFKLYSAAGLGYTADRSKWYNNMHFLPCATPIAVRYAWKHLYLFQEVTLYSPIAFMLHIGGGYRF